MFLKNLRISNLLSFGPDALELPLQPLNILIGANGSGKSNLLEAISLLQSAPKDLGKPVRDAGGIEEWLWKPGGRDAIASIEAIVEYSQKNMPIRHSLSFRNSGNYFDFIEERIENRDPDLGHDDSYFYYRFKDGRALLNDNEENRRELRRETIHPEESILSQRKDIDHYPEITWLGESYQSMRIYREWSIGRFTAPRLFQDSTSRSSGLNEDYANLGLVLKRLKKDYDTRNKISSYLNKFNGDIRDFDIDIDGSGKIQIYLVEKHSTIPATRLSDGTLRFISLLAILCNPSPPPLICIEEPEMALHPDIIPTIADLLTDASQRTQLIVTTHSDILIDAFTETPEAVIVCDKSDMQTYMRRLNQDDLKQWIDEYRLGEAWLNNMVGGHS
ncbi:MAG: AAA family ATPase [Magnetococcales bacterium]|nr:AAA family ATPase [Magnetococcales bacterium]